MPAQSSVSHDEPAIASQKPETGITTDIPVATFAPPAPPTSSLPSEQASARLGATRPTNTVMAKVMFYVVCVTGSIVGLLVIAVIVTVIREQKPNIPPVNVAIQPPVVHNPPVASVPPIEADASIKICFDLSNWKRDGGGLTFHLKAKTFIDPGPQFVAEFFDKDNVKINESTVLVASTMRPGDIIEESIYIFPEKLNRTVRIKLASRRFVP